LAKEESKKPNMTLNDRAFTKGFWCFDTPGVVNKQQVLFLFFENFLLFIPFYFYLNLVVFKKFKKN
jgi:hypothetical protein